MFIIKKDAHTIRKTSPLSNVRRIYLTSRGNNAGIRFPIGDVHAHLRRTKSRYLITNDAAVFVGGVIDYLCAEVLEQAGYLGTLKGNPSGSRVIQPVHLRLVFSQDQELRLLLRNILPTSSRHYPDQDTMEQDLNHTFQSLSIESE